VDTPRTSRGAYHHGDLRNALLESGLGLARKGGPEAVVLRAAARESGVSPTAAYRHFANREDLLYAVKLEALNRLAAAMEAELSATAPRREPAEEAARRIRALGTGYLRFALEDPGLFRTGFCDAPNPAIEPARSYSGVLDSPPFAMLADTLDTLVASGVLAAEAREYGELAAWAVVHGLAGILLDGVARMLPGRELQKIVDRSLDLVIEGFAGAAAERPSARRWVRPIWPAG
jgi:AcrR family transcriptional regulator